MEKNKWWKRLYPIRVPSGWNMVLHKLEWIEAEELEKDDKVWLFHFVQDILYMEMTYERKVNKQVEKQVISIDLGWYPDGVPEGAYILQAILNHNWEEPLLEYKSRSTKEVVEQLEEWLYLYFSSGFLDEKIFRKNVSRET